MIRVSAKIDLLPYEVKHAEEVFTVVDRWREDLRVWLPWVDATASAHDTEAFIVQSVAEFGQASMNLGIWVDGTYAGSTGFRLDLANAKVEIGYWIAPDQRGKGIVTACCQSQVQYAFSELNCHRIEIRCATGNLRSRAIPERLGFQFEGILRGAQKLNSGFVDLAIYGRLSTDPITTERDREGADAPSL